jgi:hypothetical protein
MLGPDRRSHYISLSRWRERVRVRVAPCFIPLTIVLSPRGEEMRCIFIKMCQNTPQLCWGDEWPTLSPGWERVRVRGK